MKKTILAMVFILSLNAVIAQNKPNREKIEALKIAYITEKLELTEKESQLFWPIYNDYKKEKRAITSGMKPERKPNLDEMSDDEINTFITQKFKSEEQMLALKKQYYEKCKSILSIRKIGKLIHLEKEFRREILNRVNSPRK